MFEGVTRTPRELEKPRTPWEESGDFCSYAAFAITKVAAVLLAMARHF